MANSNSTNQLLKVTQKLAKSSEETTLTVQKIKAINESLVDTSQKQYDVVNNVFSDGNQINDRMAVSVEQANDSLAVLNKTMSTIETDFNRIEESVHLFDKIQESTQSLYQVARYTKMLALNTAVLGGAAGGANSGITIVAQEMQELVKTCEAASKNIDQVVSFTRDSLVEIIQENKRHIQAGRENTSKVEEALQSLISLFNGSDHVAPEDQQASVRSIVEAVGNIEKLAHNVMRIAEDTKSETQVLNNEVEVSNLAVSDLIGIITNTPITNISPQHALERLEDFRIIDVRRPDEYNDQLGHIAKAKLLPILDNEFKKKLSSLTHTKTYLFVCRSGGRSSRAARIAQNLGFTQIYNLEGGMLAWDKGGLPVSRE